MFLITADFRASRSSGKNKAGVVFYKIVGSQNNLTGKKIERKINSPIRGCGKEILKEERVAIKDGLKLLYCVIEMFESKGMPYTIDDVSSYFRKALNGDSHMGDIVAKSKTDFVLASDVVSIGYAFKGEFQYNYTARKQCCPNSLSDYIDKQIRLLRNQNRMSSAQAYTSTLNSIREYAGKDSIAIDNVGKEWIEDYEKFLVRKGLKSGTVSFYLRNLRAILKKAASDGYIQIAGDWFNDVDTSIYRSEAGSNSNVLSPEMIAKIQKLDLSVNPTLELARDMFLFGFYCRGLELVDVANLSSCNIQGDWLVYNKRLKGSLRRIPLESAALELIEKYKGQSRVHLFPLLDDYSGRLFSSVRNAVNISMKAIGKMIGVPALSFSMNIDAWNSLLSENRLIDTIFSHRPL